VADFLLQFGGKLFVGVKGEDPIAGALSEGEVFLCGETTPWALKDSRVEAAGDVESAIGRARVYDDDFVGPGCAGKGACKILFFVEGDDRDGQKRHRGRWRSLQREGALRERDAWVVELFAEQAFGEDAKVLAGLGKGEGLHGFIPFQFVGRGKRRDPNLSNRGIWSEDELCGAVLEEDVEDAIFFVGFKTASFLSAEEGLLEGFQGFVGFVAESSLVNHAETSVTVARVAGRGG